MSNNLEIAKQYLTAIEQGVELDKMADFFASDFVALEVLWTGTLAVAFGTIPESGQMRAHFAMFLEFRDGKIVAQRNYDCFEPW